jgi:hypothetical protein
MSRYLPLTLFACLVCLVPALTQEDKKKGETEPCTVSVRFADGSVVQMILQQEMLAVETKYGKLTVPASDIHRIEFAFRVPEEISRKIETGIKSLADNLHVNRETASKELVGLGISAVPALREAARSPDPEVARRATDALAQINEKTPLERLSFPANDTIRTAEFDITGRIVNHSIKARTTYFGEVDLRLADLRHMAWLSGGRANIVMVEASRRSQWIETEITADGQTKLLITATGQVDLQPQAPGQHLSGPSGYRGFGTTVSVAGARGARGRGAEEQLQPALGGAAAAKAKTTAVQRLTVFPGTLLGRIGENGNVFVVGDRYEGLPGEEGKLYLFLAPSPESPVATGAYTVRVTKNP